jgi:hypothetical protein
MITMISLGIVLFCGGLMLIAMMGTNSKDTYNAADWFGSAFCIAGVFFLSTSLAFWLGW